MSKFMQTRPTSSRLWLLLLLAATLVFAGCTDDDSKVTNTGSFHGKEDWASIQNLDPRGEGCVDCHGKNNDMSPYNDGFMAHNIGLQKNTDNSIYADLKITSVTVNADKDGGVVEVQLSRALPDDANLNMVFAKLSPRIRHARGHDWQNYLNAESARSKDEPNAVIPIGVSPQRAQGDFVKITNNRKTLSFDMKDGYGWGEHSFTVTDKDGVAHSYSLIGTKVKITDLATHTSCYAANENSHQVVDSQGDKIICWWPDGSHLPSGVFVSDDSHLYVSYEGSYTHRIGLAIRSGNPAFNTWFDFIPDQPSVVINEDWHKDYNDRFLAIDWRGDNNADSHGQVASTAFQKLPASREIVDIQSCNSCHDNLTRHGDRSETQLCVTCHNPGNLEPRSGRSLDLKNLVHRIHRGDNLPSEKSATVAARDDISNKVNAKGGHGLLSDLATDWTKVRFPQGPTPGNAAGITNCVKCHMGPETQRIADDIAVTLGAGQGYNAQKELKLAKVTPQGDNWLGVRSIEACRGCHDTVIWSRGAGQGNQADMAKAVPLYGDDYLGIGYAFTGRENNGNHANVTVGTTAVNSNGDQFTCGSGGGCHNNPKLSTLLGAAFGTKSGNSVQANHLQLTRNYIIAERFEIQIENPKIDGTVFKADVRVLDKKTGSNLAIDADRKTTPDTTLGELELTVGGNLGWMHNSPDFNHSPGGGIPGSPLGVTVVWDGSDTGKASADLSAMSRADEWEKIKDDFANVVGSVYIEARAGNYNFKTAVADFRFDGNQLADNEGRRKVVDFLAGNGNDPDRGRYDGWDKEHGSNTQSCSSCHLQLAYHGGGRRTNNVQACIVCHNPQRTDVNTATRRGVLSDKDGQDGQYEESLDFKRLIHAIHSAPNKRIDPMYVGTANARPSIKDGEELSATVRGNSFPGVISNCKSCHIQDADSGLWTFDLQQLPEGMIGSTAITADWSMLDPDLAGTANYDNDGKRHDFANHKKMSPIASVCSSCHDAGYKNTAGRMNDNTSADGGPYIGSHWWMQGGIAPGIVAPGADPQSTIHQSGEYK